MAYNEQLKRYLEYSRYEISYFVHIWTHIKNWLPVDIALDDDAYYKYNSHPVWLYFRNSYDDSCEDWLPVVVDKNPYIPLSDAHLNIAYLDYLSVCQFIHTYCELIKKLADSEINISDFVSNVMKRVV